MSDFSNIKFEYTRQIKIIVSSWIIIGIFWHFSTLEQEAEVLFFFPRKTRTHLSCIVKTMATDGIWCKELGISSFSIDPTSVG